MKKVLKEGRTDERNAPAFAHTPVMIREAVDLLKCRPECLYIDGTVGGAGHSRAILEASAPSGTLFGIDRDPDAVKAAGESLKCFGGRAHIVQGAFSKFKGLMKDENIGCADGILLDLGVSSYQLEARGRGFSFGAEGPLDMRMDPSCTMSAADAVRDLSENDLSRVIFEFGEERFARKIAHNIVMRRSRKPILTTKDLVDVIVSSVPPFARRGRIHPATRTFQALRIFVNDELGELERFLDFAPEVLCGGGRLVIISYHSLEDRLVKRAFKGREANGGFFVVTKKVVTPQHDEVQRNPRSRSAKLRALERLEGL